MFKLTKIDFPSNMQVIKNSFCGVAKLQKSILSNSVKKKRRKENATFFMDNMNQWFAL